MKKFTLSMAGFLALFTFCCPAKADHLSDRLTFSARMGAAPGVTTTGNGVAAFMLNSTRDTMYFTASFAKLSSALTGFHIHNARLGGSIVVDFDGKVEVSTVRSFIAGSQLTSLLPDFIGGHLYIAAHTVTNPAVEILGFITQETDWGFSASLDGSQSGTSSTATGLASLHFGMKGDTAIVKVVSNMTNKIISAHIHWGKPGQSGSVALGFNSLIRSDSMSLLGGVTVSPTQWTNIMAALLADSIYLNLHTAAFPAGEIRGQVRTTRNLRFDSWLNQAAEFAGGANPPVVSSGYGVSTMWMNSTMDTLVYSVYFSSLVGKTTAAHFHSAAPNASGGVVKPVTITGNTISGMWTKLDASNPLTNTLIGQLLMGNLYLNIHTDSNPGGEIRGQVYRFAREGFIAELNGAQAGTTSGGLGTMVASYDRERTNLHTMLSFEGVSGNPSAAHIHLGARGQSGPVAIDLAPLIDNGSYLFSKASAGFNDVFSIPLRKNDSTYVNVHTAVNPAGDIRGQLMRYYRISSPTVSTGIRMSDDRNGIKAVLYPNPSEGQVRLSIRSDAAATGNFVVRDLRGREVTIITTPINKGVNEIEIDLKGIPDGLYLGSLEVPGKESTVIRVMKK